MGEDNNAATAASLMRGVVLRHCLKVEHRHQLPCLAVGMKPFVTHRLATMAYGMHDLLNGLNPTLLKWPSNDRNYLSYILYTISYILYILYIHYIIYYIDYIYVL